MLTEIKKSDIKSLYPVPRKDSHKGENGQVMIVGGSRDYYGAPVLAGMGALFGGTDLVTLCVAACNFDVSRSYYPDFIVKSFVGDFLDARSVEMIVEMSGDMGALVMGPGIGNRQETMAAMEAIIKKTKCPLVLDSYAIYSLPRDNTRNNSNILITPHAREFSNFTRQPFPNLLIERVEMVKKYASLFNVNILLKGPTDVIAGADGQHCINQTGNPGMTSGGTGDVLAGFTGGLMARGVKPYDAGRAGAFLVGTAGDELQKEKGHAFIATDLALHLPSTLHRLVN